MGPEFLLCSQSSSCITKFQRRHHFEDRIGYSGRKRLVNVLSSKLTKSCIEAPGRNRWQMHLSKFTRFANVDHLIDKMLTRTGQNALKRFFVNIPQYQAKLKTYSSNFKELRACSLSISTTCIICPRPKSLIDLYKRSLSPPSAASFLCRLKKGIDCTCFHFSAHE